MRAIAHMAGIDFTHHGIGLGHHSERTDNNDPDCHTEHGRIDGQHDKDQDDHRKS